MVAADDVPTVTAKKGMMRFGYESAAIRYGGGMRYRLVILPPPSHGVCNSEQAMNNGTVPAAGDAAVLLPFFRHEDDVEPLTESDSHFRRVLTSCVDEIVICPRKGPALYAAASSPRPAAPRRQRPTPWHRLSRTAPLQHCFAASGPTCPHDVA